MKEWFAANKVKVCVIIGVLLLLSVAGIAIGLHLRGDDKTTVAEEPGKTTDEEPKTQETCRLNSMSMKHRDIWITMMILAL